MKIVVCSGGFDPIHSGHIEYLREARKLGDLLVVAINSDAWLTRKKGRPFMPATERRAILEAMSFVDAVIEFDDSDGSAIGAIRRARELYPDAYILFGNGGDRNVANIPEMDFKDDRLEFVFSVGTDIKRNSSSWILAEWKAPKTERPWGYYRVLHEDRGVKVKELTVNPGKSLSMQRHQFRSEYWLVSEGCARVNAIDSHDHLRHTDLEFHDAYDIEENEWHQLTNPYDKPVKIIEIQYGYRCEEDDIERKPE